MFDHITARRRSRFDSLSLSLAAVFFAFLFAGFPVAALDLEQRSVAAAIEARATQPAAVGHAATAEDELAMIDRCRDLLGLDGNSDTQAVDCARGHDDSSATR